MLKKKAIKSFSKNTIKKTLAHLILVKNSSLKTFKDNNKVSLCFSPIGKIAFKMIKCFNFTNKLINPKNNPKNRYQI